MPTPSSPPTNPSGPRSSPKDDPKVHGMEFPRKRVPLSSPDLVRTPLLGNINPEPPLPMSHDQDPMHRQAERTPPPLPLQSYPGHDIHRKDEGLSLTPTKG